jgi:hypothetical protein
MPRGKSLCAKRARLLSLNQIREIMDSDSDESQYNSSGTEDEEMEPHPPSQKSHLSQAVFSSDVSASTSENEDVENVAIQQPQSTQWTLPLYPRKCVLHPFTGAPKGKAVRLRCTDWTTPHHPQPHHRSKTIHSHQHRTHDKQQTITGHQKYLRRHQKNSISTTTKNNTIRKAQFNPSDLETNQWKRKLPRRITT